MGKYGLQEIETIDGVVLDDTIYEINFIQDNLTQKVYTETKNIKNSPTLLQISKTDITGDEELENAKLTVFDEKNNIIDTWISTKNKHYIEGLSVDKTFTLREEIAPDGMVKATDIQFTIDNTGKIQTVVMIDKIVQMRKIDIAGTEIIGAKMQVFNLEDGTLIDEWISEETPHNIKNLSEGKSYLLHEDACVDGFVKASDITFEVTTDKQNQMIELVDKIVLVSKTDITTGQELPGANLKIVDEDGNIIEEWISTDTPHQVSGLEENRNYTLIETTAPYGYEISEQIDFQVSSDKNTQVVEMKDAPILKVIKVQKIDSETKEKIKAKFTFGLYEDEECTKLIQQMDSNIDEAAATFEELRYGTYFIKELSSPDGYQLSDKIIKVTIDDKGVFADGQEITEDENSIYTFDFENIKIPDVDTGSNISHATIFVVMGICILTIIAGFMFLRKFI